MIATQADGHYAEDGGLSFSLKKQRKIDRLKMLLRKNEIPFVVNRLNNDVVRIGIHGKNVPFWLVQFRKKLYDYWMLDLNLDVLFDELPNWDGNWAAPNSLQYCTSKKQNADVVQACALCNGFYASVVKKNRSEINDKWSESYVVNVWVKPSRGNRVLPTDTTEEDFSGYVYCAETPTGYFMVRRNGKVWMTGNSGRLVQVQNLARNSLPDLDLARQLVCEGRFDDLELLFGEPAFVFSELVRTAFIPSPDHQFVVADFSAIEARVLGWLAGEQWVLDAFSAGKDIYCETASQMYHCNVVKHGENGHLRQKGKIAVLACGYQGGVGAMKRMDREGAIPEEELQSVVDQWRLANSQIVKFWRTVELAAKTAINDCRKVRIRNGMAFSYKDKNLYIQLPNGRSICYWNARLTDDPTGKESIVFWSVNAAHQWAEEETYGGKITENITQAVARDCLAETIKRVSAMGYQIVMHVHDEIIVDVPADDWQAYEKILTAMKEPIPWAPGLPLNADGYTCSYYRKD